MPNEHRPLKVFLCYAHSDAVAVRVLYSRLKREGVDVWLDKEKLLPGSDWELEIRKAVREADVVVVCLSKQFNQAGFRQKEVRIALETAMEQPEGEIFIIPARLEECETLESLSKWHWVNLFEEDGYHKLIRALRERAARIGATLRIRKGGQSITSRPKSKEVEKANNSPVRNTDSSSVAVADIQEIQSLEKASHKAAIEETERDLVEKIARDEAVEKAKRERDEYEIAEKSQQAKAERDAAEKATREKMEPETTKKPSQERRFEVLKPRIEKPQEQKTKLLRKPNTIIFVALIGFVVTIIAAVLVSPLIEEWFSSVPVSTEVATATSTLTSQQITPSRTLDTSPTPVETVTPAPTSFEVINSNNLEKLTEINRWKDSAIDTTTIFWSPDSKQFAAQSYDRDISIFSLEGDVQILPTTEEIEILGFSAEGNLIGSAWFEERVISLWKNLLLDTNKQKLTGHSQNISRVILSSDGKLLISGSNDNTIKVWQVSDGTLLHTFVGHTHDIWNLAISPDKKYIASDSGDSTVRLWDTSSDTPPHTFQVQGQILGRPLAFSPDGNILASYASYTAIALWNVADGRLIKTLECGEISQFTSRDIRFSPDGQYLAIKSCNNKLIIWSIFGDGEKIELVDSPSGIEKFTFLVDSQVLVTSDQKEIRFYDANNGKLLHTIETEVYYEVWNLDITPDGRFLFGCDDSNIFVWGIPK